MRRIQLGSLAAIVLCLTACHNTPNHEAWFGNTTPLPPNSGFRQSHEPATLDPALSTSNPEINIIGALFEGLVQNDPPTAPWRLSPRIM
jgi:ABC-type oligopeptide transport system substrate-binding subunit